MNNKGEMTAIELMIICCIFGLLLAIFIPAFFRPRIEAEIYNEKYGTNYTKWDFFWAGDTIKDYLEDGKKSTLNLNIK